MSRRGVLTRWELGLGLLLLLVVGAYATPIVERATWRTRREEVPMILHALHRAQEAWAEEQGGWMPLDGVPRGAGRVGRDAVPWSGLPEGFPLQSPMPAVRGSYRTEETPEGPVLHGVIDVDGDGEPARFRLVPGEAARRLTGEDVY